MTEQQRQTDNRLLEMIQRNFPSLPLDDRYTDWSKWLGFARAAYEAGALDERVACELRCAKTPVLLQGHHEYTALNVQKMMMEAISERPND